MRAEFTEVPTGASFVATASSSDGRYGRCSFIHDRRTQSLTLLAGTTLLLRLVDQTGAAIETRDLRMLASCFDPGSPKAKNDAAAWRSESDKIVRDEATGILRFAIPTKTPLSSLTSFPCPTRGTLRIEHPLYETKILEFGPLRPGEVDLGTITLEDWPYSGVFEGLAPNFGRHSVTSGQICGSLGDQVISLPVRASRTLDNQSNRIWVGEGDRAPADLASLFAGGTLQLPEVVLRRDLDLRYFQRESDGTFREVEAKARMVDLDRTDSSRERFGVLGIHWRGVSCEYQQVHFASGSSSQRLCVTIPSDASGLTWSDLDHAVRESSGPTHSFPLPPGTITVTLP